jgi:hypothetical protein
MPCSDLLHGPTRCSAANPMFGAHPDSFGRYRFARYPLKAYGPHITSLNHVKSKFVIRTNKSTIA